MAYRIDFAKPFLANWSINELPNLGEKFYGNAFTGFGICLLYVMCNS